MRQLELLDSVFLAMEKSNSPMHIGVLNIYDMSTTPNKTLRFKEILQEFSNSIPATPVYRRKLKQVPFGVDRPYWIDDADFDLEYHVRHIALPQPGDWRQLCILAARIYSRQLDMTRPPWECYVIEGLDNVEGLPKGSFAMLFKYHHAAFDGKSAHDALFAALHKSDPTDTTAYRDSFEPESEPSNGELLFRAGFNLVRSPYMLFENVRQLLKEKKPEAKLAKAPEIERIRFNQPITSNRVFASVDFSVAQLKAIKDQVEGTTINDVVLTIVGGALRKYLANKGELPESTLNCGVPMSIRRESDPNGGNLVTVLNISLATEIESPVERLKAISADVQQHRLSNDAVRVRQQLATANNLPSAMMSLGMQAATREILLNRMKPPFNTTVTNVPGPQHPVYFCGAKMVKAVGMGCPMSNMGLFHTVSSYNGELNITPISCREMLPDPDLYAQYLQESYDELEAALVKKDEPKKKRSASNKKSGVKKSAKTSATKIAKKAAKKAAKKVTKKVSKKKASKKKASKKKAKKVAAK